jgi:hypothetical protein
MGSHRSESSDRRTPQATSKSWLTKDAILASGLWFIRYCTSLLAALWKVATCLNFAWCTVDDGVRLALEIIGESDGIYSKVNRDAFHKSFSHFPHDWLYCSSCYRFGKVAKGNTKLRVQLWLFVDFVVNVIILLSCPTC